MFCVTILNLFKKTMINKYLSFTLIYYPYFNYNFL